MTQGKQSEGVKTMHRSEWEVGTRDSKHTALLRNLGRGQELGEDTGSGRPVPSGEAGALPKVKHRPRSASSSRRALAVEVALRTMSVRLWEP